VNLSQKRLFVNPSSKKNAVFWDVTPCGYCKSQRFGGTYRLHRQGKKNRRVFLRRGLRSLVTATVVPSSIILSTLMAEAIRFSETSVVTRATQRNNSEDGILHNHRRENLKSYIALIGWAL
jgi:hypothetical protein